MTCKQQRDK